MDINHDGVLDFYYFGRPSAVYSVGERYYGSYRKLGKNGFLKEESIFPPSNNICKFVFNNEYVYIRNNQLYFKSISEEGKSYVCNLTKLTTQSHEKE